MLSRLENNAHNSLLTTLLTPSTALGWNRSSSFERHKRREREGNNYFRPEDAKR